MTSERPSDLDLLALAEDIAADRRTLSNVIDQLNASEPDDAARREAVSELQSLVVALTAVRRHARATAEAQLGVQAGPAVAERLVVEPASVQRRSRPMQLSRASLPRLVAGVGTALLAVVVVAVVATTLRSTPAVGGPTPPPVSSAPVASADPSASAPATSSSAPTALAAAGDIDRGPDGEPLGDADSGDASPPRLPRRLPGRPRRRPAPTSSPRSRVSRSRVLRGSRSHGPRARRFCTSGPGILPPATASSPGSTSMSTSPGCPSTTTSPSWSHRMARASRSMSTGSRIPRHGTWSGSSTRQGSCSGPRRRARPR